MTARPRLCELDWFKDVYARIYNILSIGDLLPHPCDILVLPPEDQTVQEIAQRVVALGLAFPEKNTIWFRKQPPDPVVFAHELIHLIKEKPRELEEVYAYNLSSLAVILAERNVIPPINITRLFSASLNEILEALRRVYNIKFKDVVEFFEFIGVVPAFMMIEPDVDRIRFTINKDIAEKAIAINTVTELAAGAEYDRLMFDALIELMKILAEKERGEGHAQEG